MVVIAIATNKCHDGLSCFLEVFSDSQTIDTLTIRKTQATKEAGLDKAFFARVAKSKAKLTEEVEKILCILLYHTIV